MLIKHQLFYFVFIFFINLIQSQSFDIYHDSIKLYDYNYNLTSIEKLSSFHAYPQSVKIENFVNELLDPIIQLNSSEKLKLSFDILDNEVSSYAYTFIHCDANWEYSDMIQLEYLDGFFNNYINDYQYSFNTTASYIHYHCEFPNEHVNFKKSGNYIILVYDTDKNKAVITKRFMIYEDILDIKMKVKQATLPQDIQTKHEIDFSIEGHKQLNIIDPKNELQIIVQKNDDWNNLIKNCTPSFIDNKKLEYNYQGEISFLAGNEYRDFDIKSLRYYSKNIKSIEQDITQGNSMYLVNLKHDNPENTQDYIFKYDLNGKYLLSVSENKDKYTEGDYVLVKFILNHKKIENSAVYIYGELTNWDFLTQAKLNYNEKDEQYYGFLYLKQGYYNYQYMVKNNKTTYSIDSDYHETRNQYSIYVYHTPLWKNYDRLIGVSKSTSNSLN